MNPKTGAVPEKLECTPLAIGEIQACLIPDIVLSNTSHHHPLLNAKIWLENLSVSVSNVFSILSILGRKRDKYFDLLRQE